ncbi:MAG TPA: hypothetical protein VNM92_06765 [Thermoanaerobaculia bacterium]|nr:hypothetical protein [Thermoanaerobaculia bacterium]
MRIATTLLLIFATSALADEKTARHPFQETVSSAGVERVIIEIPASELVISNGSAREVRLVGTAERDYDGSRDLERAQRIVDASAVRMRMDGTSLVLSRVLGRGAGKRSWTELTMFKLHLSVPEGMSIELEQRFGEVEMKGLFGDVKVDMKAGEVRIETPRRAIRELSVRAHIGEVSTNLGEKVIRKEGIFAGTTDYFNQNGRSSLVVNLAVGEIDIILTD